MLRTRSLPFVVPLLLLAGARAQVTSASPEPHPVYGAPVVTSSGTLHDVDFGDMDGDGRDDLIATAPTGLQRALGVGDGSFGAPFTYAGTAGLQRTVVADLDGDGHQDVVSGAAGAAGSAQVFAGDGAGGLGSPTVYPFSSNSFDDGFDIVAGDSDADGDLDLAVCASPDFFFDPNGGYLGLLVNDGSGAFTPVEAAPGDLLDQCRAQPCDLNGDAWGDLLVSGWTGVGPMSAHRPLLGQPGGGFAVGEDILGSSIISLVTDVNGDGLTDLLVGGTIGFGTWLGAGDGTFANLETHLLGFGGGSAPSGFATHDLDGDGLVDIVAYRGPVGDAYVFEGVGGGTTTEGTALSLALGPTVNFTEDSHLVDLDGDGRVDFGSGQGMHSATPHVVTVLDVTYPDGGPITDFGGKVRGVPGFPVNIVSGTFVPGGEVTFSLSVAKIGAKAFLVAGLQAAFMPFKGNVLVPQADIVAGPFIVDAAGKLDVHATWPADFPPGQTVDVQFWVKDPNGLKGFAASSDAHIVQP
ncbi:MAG TPA: VCBS repeat-containing protein [Planctomycetota bacterium]|nr:VCBS repeat-containing protein [Planctomycetota bacterium]